VSASRDRAAGERDNGHAGFSRGGDDFAHLRDHRHDGTAGTSDRDRRRPPHTPLFDLALLVYVVEALRRALPADLRTRATDALREFLLALRDLIDWYLERLDGRRRQPEVEEIPLE